LYMCLGVKWNATKVTTLINGNICHIDLRDRLN
jgi:hypothetical protein